MPAVKRASYADLDATPEDDGNVYDLSFEDHCWPFCRALLLSMGLLFGPADVRGAVGDEGPLLASSARVPRVVPPLWPSSRRYLSLRFGGSGVRVCLSDVNTPSAVVLTDVRETTSELTDSSVVIADRAVGREAGSA
jgi:hypothetical protein